MAIDFTRFFPQLMLFDFPPFISYAQDNHQPVNFDIYCCSSLGMSLMKGLRIQLHGELNIIKQD
jgi:hypothetical protein